RLVLEALVARRLGQRQVAGLQLLERHRTGVAAVYARFDLPFPDRIATLIDARAPGALIAPACLRQIGFRAPRRRASPGTLGGPLTGGRILGTRFFRMTHGKPPIRNR